VVARRWQGCQIFTGLPVKFFHFWENFPVLAKFAFSVKKWVYWKILEIPARALVRGRAWFT